MLQGEFFFKLCKRIKLILKVLWKRAEVMRAKAKQSIISRHPKRSEGSSLTRRDPSLRSG